MKAIGKYIVITPIEKEVKTDSGLILSGKDIDDMRYKRGIVVTPGIDVVGINPGDEIYYDKVHSFTMIIGESHCTVIQERDVVVVV
jgi:co-chaperonin GroES (HSP10)